MITIRARLMSWRDLCLQITSTQYQPMKVIIQGAGQDGKILAEQLTNEGIPYSFIARQDPPDPTRFFDCAEAYFLAGPSVSADICEIGPALTAVTNFLTASRLTKRRLVMVSPYAYVQGLRTPYAMYHRMLLDLSTDEMDKSCVPLTVAVCYNHDSIHSRPEKFLQRVARIAAQERFDITHRTYDLAGCATSLRTYARAHEFVRGFRAAILLGGTYHFFGPHLHSCAEIVNLASELSKRTLRIRFMTNVESHLLPSNAMTSLVKPKILLETLLGEMIEAQFKKLQDENTGA